MRNIFILIALAFCVYFGSSLWTFSSADPASFRVVSNYIPLTVMFLTLVIGLIHLRFALALTIIYIFFCGNAAIFDYLLYSVLSKCGVESFFGVTVQASMRFFQSAKLSYECILLSLFAAWAITRFFGNPELDFEVNRARTARQLNFPIFIFGLTAVIAAIYSIVALNNVFMPGFFGKLKDILCKFPYPFFHKTGAGPLQSLRAATLAIEFIALYTVVINEVWSEKHIKFYLGLLLGLGLASVFIGIVQRLALTGFSNYVYRYTREVHATFTDPNAWAAFLFALLPVGLGLLFAGFVPAICGFITILLFLLGIFLAGSKVLLLFSFLTLIVFFIWSLIKSFKGGKIVPPVFIGVLLVGVIVFSVGSYLNVDKEELLSTKNSAKAGNFNAKKDVDNPNGKPFGIFHNSLATSVANQIDSFRQSLSEPDPDLPKVKAKSFDEKLYAATNHKSADWLTVWNFLRPKNGNWDYLCLGCGPGNFKRFYGTYQPKYLKERRTGAGNIFLQALVEQGVFGFVTLVLVTIITIYVAFGCVEHTISPRTSRVLAWMFTFLVVGCFFENAFSQYQIASLYWLLCGLVMVNSATTNRDFQPSFKFFYVLLLILTILGAVAAFWPKLMAHHAEKRSFDTAVGRLEAITGEDLSVEDREALYSKQELYFHYNQIGRWSDKRSFMLIKPEKGLRIMRMEAANGNPNVTPQNPLEVEVLVENESAMKFFFTNSCLKTLEYDLGTTAQNRALYQERDYMVVEIRNSQTFVPAELYPQLTNQNYNVGCFIGKVTFHKEQTLPPFEEFEEPDTEEQNETPVTEEEKPVIVEVKEEEKKEIEVPKETIFGDKVKEEDLDETLQEMSNFELELPQ